MLPEGWDYQPLRELASVKRGRFSPRPRNDPRYYDGYMPFVQTGDVTQAGKYLTVASQSLNAEGVAVSKVFPPNSILITIAANIGHTAITTFDVACPDSVVGIQPIADRCDVRWLKDVLDTRRDDLEALATQNAQKNINLEILTPFELLTPPLPEQRRIAAVLDAWDTAIATAERLVAAKRARFDWIRDQVLTGHRRLHGFNDVWRKVRLADIVDEHGLCATGAEEVFSVSVHKGLVNQVEHLGRSFSAKDTGHYNRVRPGDIVYTKSPTGDFPLGIIKQSKVEKDVIVSPLYGVFTPRTRELGLVLDAYFTSPKATEKYLTPLVQKGAKNTIAVTNTQFLQGMLSVPGDEREVATLAELVDASLAEIRAGETELDRFRTQKRGLMQQLLTGNIPVPDSIDALMPDRLEVAA